MLDIGPDLVRLGLTARDKEAAIRQTAAILAEAGCVDAAYGDSMIAREAQTATYLGNGIAIPHGLRSDGGLIRKTAVAVAQFPQGVDWGGAGTVHLAVGIAAMSDEHIQVLANLTDVLQDAAIADRLAHTGDAAEIIRALTAPRAVVAAKDEDLEGFDARAEVTVSGGAGLHARPATEFAALAKRFDAEIRVRHGARTANGKAMASLLTLGVESGASIVILARGGDASEAVRALEDAVASGLGEDQDEDEQAAAPPPTAPVVLPFTGDARDGVAAAPGIAWGPAHHLRRPEVVVSDSAASPEEERARLRNALEEAREQLQDLHARVSARSGSRKAAIFLAHQEFLDDPDLQAEAQALIVKGLSAARAWHTATHGRADALARLDDPLLAGRAGDMRDVGERVLRILAGGGHAPSAPDLPDHPVVVIADDLAPSDTATLDPARVRALATARGGPNSHTAILARSLNLPAVVGLGDDLLDIADGTGLIVDGDGGVLVVTPPPSDQAIAEKAAEERAATRRAARQDAYRPAHTRDGRRLEIVANIGKAAEAAAAVEAGAEGVGLLRTEFLFLERDAPPSEEEQLDALREMARALNGLPLIVRTLDIGGDKEVPYLRLPKEDNPFLGVRGLRLCLARPDLFEPQLRAIVRVAKESQPGAIKIMFPMVATLEEVKEARAVLERIRADLDGPILDCGVMIEVPSAALMADALAEAVDFFSIGTNDLTQYALAMDRLHPTLTKRADALHPAVLRLIAQVVKAAHGRGRWVGVCGNMAAERAAAPILVGLGVDELSVSPPAVADLKAQVRTMTMARARALAERALACATAAEVRALH